MYQYYSYTIASSVQLSAVRWFLEEDDGEAESAKSEMMVASSVLCDLTPHCFVIEGTGEQTLSSILYMRPSTGERGETLHFSIPSINPRELRFHPFGFGNTVHNGSHDAKSYFHIWLHIMDALNRTSWFCTCVLSIQISIILIKKLQNQDQ